jgi:hypothetical protein
VLENAIVTSNYDIKGTITFIVITGNSNSELNGGTTNIAFFAGPQTPFAQPPVMINNVPRVKSVIIPSPGESDDLNAYADFMTSSFYIERIEYDVVVNQMEESETQILLASFPPGRGSQRPSSLSQRHRVVSRRGRRSRCRAFRSSIHRR